MKQFLFIRALCVVFIFYLLPNYAAAQASCATAVTLTPGSTCTAVTGNLRNAVNATPAGSCGGATVTTTFSVWYKFTTTSTTNTITVNNLGANLSAATTYVEVLSGTCATLASVACSNVTNRLTVTGMAMSTQYYVRVYTTVQGTANPTSKWDFDICIQTQPANDNCSGAVTLTSNTSCSNTTSTLDLSTVSTGLPAGCESASSHYDVWFKFTAASAIQTITVSNLGANITSPEMQIYSGGACGTLSSLQCTTSTSMTVSGLTIGSVYFVRFSNLTTNPSGTGGVASFDICVTHIAPPANDDCAGAISLTPGAACSNTSGTVVGATISASIPVGCAGAGSHYDVWYKFVAGATYESVTLSGLGANFTNPEIQVFSGTCGALTSLQCGTTMLTVTGLTVGTTYYLRISNIGSYITASGGFSVCVFHPAAATYDFGKSYVNISRNSGGGTINVGDTLEIRGTLVIRSSSLDSLGFFDTLRNNGGLRLIPGSLALRTNEGKIYKSFSDAFDSDAGYYYTNGADTVIRINMGTSSSGSLRGRLFSTSKPSVFGATCIIMATYRVVVYGAYGTTLNVGGGAFTIKDGGTGAASVLGMSNRNAYVYNSPGLCPNAVSATNAIGGDFNGTFGTPSTGAPLVKNRGTSVNVPGYIYAAFGTGAPQDYYYGITNNTSGSGTSFTVLNTWAKPDNTSPTHRVFNVWDIIGDHTGASNTAKGNPPCDTTKPVSATNPCGYMLVINSAYKTDTAFQYSVTNLCPNTYYEISAWVRNICYKCSCDSNGTGASGAGYIPFATGDSSGVQPNLAFDINGTDYYTTGNIPYVGTTQAGSDSTNRWVKRGFTYLTGPSQTSLVLSIRNNAPGGGGNDWALDDISLATCLPNMSYSPSLNPPVCDSNSITINDTIRSYFNNYQYYKWQRSANNGATWTDVTGSLGPATPVWNGSAYEYVSSYTIPPNMTYMSNNNDLYRVIVATTSSNLGNTNCQVTDGVSIIKLNVIDCGILLKTDWLSANGVVYNEHARISWSTTREDMQLYYDVERSFDGVNFTRVGSLNGNNNNSELNFYTFTDPEVFNGKPQYRIVMREKDHKKYSRTIRLSAETSNFKLASVINPFSNQLDFEIMTGENSKIEASLVDLSGNRLIDRNFSIYTGINTLTIPNTSSLPNGVYILQIKNKNLILSYKVVKR